MLILDVCLGDWDSCAFANDLIQATPWSSFHLSNNLPRKFTGKASQKTIDSVGQRACKELANKGMMNLAYASGWSRDGARMPEMRDDDKKDLPWKD